MRQWRVIVWNVDKQVDAFEMSGVRDPGLADAVAHAHRRRTELLSEMGSEPDVLVVTVIAQ